MISYLPDKSTGVDGVGVDWVGVEGAATAVGVEGVEGCASEDLLLEDFLLSLVHHLHSGWACKGREVKWFIGYLRLLEALPG